MTENHPSERIEWTCKDCGAEGIGRRFLFTHAGDCPEFGKPPSLRVAVDEVLAGDGARAGEDREAVNG